MKTHHHLIIIAVLTLAFHASGADQLRAAVICSGAATLNNGSVVCIGQPFVGVMRAADNSVTLQTGFIPVASTNLTSSPPYTPMPLQPAFNLANGRFQMSFAATLGNSYVVQASTNFANWISIWTNIASGSNVLFEDPNTTNYRQRFYRVVTP